MKPWPTADDSWKTVPITSSLLFFAGVFCLFGALLLVVTSANLQSQTGAQIAWTVIVSGLFAVGWAYAGTTRKYWMFAVLFSVQLVLNYLLRNYGPPSHSLQGNPDELRHKLVFDAYVEFALMVAAYVSFCIFWS